MKSKRLIWLFMSVMTATFTTLSCSKAESSSPAHKQGAKVDISITGDFNDFGSKAEIENIFRMKWTEGDKVYVYGTTDGGTTITNLGGPLTATLVADTDGRVADLTGTITQPEVGTKLTLVYKPGCESAPAVSDNSISLSIRNQTGKADSVIFVAYATVDYKGNTSSTYRTAFKFATNVLRVNVSGMEANKKVVKASIDSIETECKLALKFNEGPTVSGGVRDTIVRDFPSTFVTNNRGNIAFYVAVPVFTADIERELNIKLKESHTYRYSKFATGAKATGGNTLNSIAAIPVPIMYKEGSVELGYGDFVPETGVIWAPRNCGYHATDFKYGKLYQWGRKEGGGYNGFESEVIQEYGVAIYKNNLKIDPAPDSLYRSSTIAGVGNAPHDWYTNDAAKLMQEWPMIDPAGTTGIGNPCPEGWRVPTYKEFKALLGGDGAYCGSSPSTKDGQSGVWLDGSGLEAESGVFFPFAGRCQQHDYPPTYEYRGQLGQYWSTSKVAQYSPYHVGCMYVGVYGSAYASLGQEFREHAYSVRCVQD